MLRRLKPSPALGVALLALFVALGGSGYAAMKINGKDIKNRSIAAKKLKNRTLTAKQVKRGSLTGKQIKRDSLTGKQIRESSLGTVPRAAVADGLGANGAKEFVPAGRFRFGDLVRMTKTGTEADTPLQALVASGPFKIEVGCYDDAGKTGAKVVVSSNEPKSVLGFFGSDEGTTKTETWSAASFEVVTDFITLLAPSGAAVGVVFEAVLNGLGTDCVYMGQYTTNR